MAAARSTKCLRGAGLGEGSSAMGGSDRLNALPDEAIHHVLGFLPARDAVRTSVLARGWRHRWKYMYSLRVNMVDPEEIHDIGRVNRLMASLLLDHHAPLDEFDLRLEGLQTSYNLEHDLWIRHAVSERHVRSLLFDILGTHASGLSGAPLVSRHLARLELRHLTLEDRILDLSSCTVLEDLVISFSIIDDTKISSQSLKRLCITRCVFLMDLRTCISAPNIISLKLDDIFCTTPSLDYMPLLETALVRIGYDDYSDCDKSDYGDPCGACPDCTADHNGGCVLLGGLSSAIHLELIAPSAKFTDLSWCPTFSKLKTLLLNDWCVSADFCKLVCVLQHCPILEKLTLQLDEDHKYTVASESYHTVEKLRPLCERLNVLQIRFVKVDDRFCKIVDIMSKFDLQINLKRMS